MATHSDQTVNGKPSFGMWAYIGLILAGLAGNYFKFALFLNIDFLFGSIFAMLALQYFGLGRGVLAAALIASTTYVLWHHPYAVVIMTAEVAVVGVLMARRNMGMVLADTVYWLLIGMPLVFVFYRMTMHSSLDNTTLTMAKQAINGIANALLARLLFIGLSLRSKSVKLPFRELLYNLMAFFVLAPTLLILVIGSRADFNDTDQRVFSNSGMSLKRSQFGFNRHTG
jgi:magnesium-transporting ATPase (P-type)